jgi:L-rhamnonate dehydratase
MRITNVETLHLRLDQVLPEADGTQECLLVRVETDTGLIGWGEVVSSSHVAKAVINAPRAAPFRHGLAVSLVGEDPLDGDACYRKMIRDTAWLGPGGVVRHAISGIDMALWDIRAQAQNVPLWKLLGGRRTVACYASVLWPREPERIAGLAQRLVEDGYTAVKFGWGPMGPDPVRDTELVAAARSSLGPSVRLMVDAGRAWDVDTALARVEAFAPYDLFWLEEALDPYDLQGYRLLAKLSEIPIACGEIHALESEFEAVLKCGIAYIQPDLGRVGGLTGAMSIEGAAAGTNTAIVPHAFGTSVLLSASAAFASRQGARLTEFTRTESPLARDLVRPDFVFKDGEITLGDRPGLGVELHADVLARYLIR